MINAFKRKVSIDKLKPKKFIINILNYFWEERLPILIPEAKVLILTTKEVDIAMIGINAYHAVCKLYGAQVFIISIRDLEYQAQKEIRPETDPKNVIPK